MDRESIINMIKGLDSIEDEAERRDQLSTLTEEVSTVFDSYEAIKSEDEKLKEENNKLVEYNRKLFMKVGFEKDSTEVEKDKTGEDPVPEPRKYEDLFDDKGNLK